MKKTCERCGAEYSTEDKRRRYCGVACYREKQRESPNSGTFRPGLTPWNRGIHGIRLSPSSEFRPGREAENRMPVGTTTVRVHSDDHPRAWVKVADPSTWKPRAVVVWEEANGPLPAGMVVHHVDRNALNDSIGNLRAMTRDEHLAEHRVELRMFEGTGT